MLKLDGEMFEVSGEIPVPEIKCGKMGMAYDGWIVCYHGSPKAGMCSSN